MGKEKGVWISSFLEPLSMLALAVKLQDVKDVFPTWALWVVGLPALASIFERGVFRFLQVCLTLLLAFFAIRIGSWTIAGHAALWGVLTLVAFQEDEARRDGHGNFLAALWWIGQAYFHYSDMRFAEAQAREPGAFTVLFAWASVYMLVHEATLGVWKRIRALR